MLKKYDIIDVENLDWIECKKILSDLGIVFKAENMGKTLTAIVDGTVIVGSGFYPGKAMRDLTKKCIKHTTGIA